MSRSLRSWQNSCITKALEHLTVTQHFFCQATPGAGKTRMAAELTSRLLQQDRIDLVLCFAPSCQVVEGFRSTFSEVLAACRTFPLAGRIAHRSWNLTV
nr:DEAD/DEAH box helicase family protein [Pseudomonas aeruginosa]